MPIDSLNTLIKNSTFKKLAEAQTRQDDADSVLMQSKMTRSPYQLLALLLIWSITKDECKASVLRKMNTMRVCIKPILEDELDDLTQSLDWKQLGLELNSSSNDFFKLELPKSVIESLKEQAIIPQDLLAKVTQEGSSAGMKVMTNIHQQLSWVEPLRPFYKNNKVIRWCVPDKTFSLSDGFVRELQEIKKKLGNESKSAVTVQLGGFEIKAEKREVMSSSPRADIYKLSIKNNGLTQLTAELPKKTAIHPGLYTAFVGATLQGEFPVKNVEVFLEGSAYLDEAGVGVKQQQEVSMEGCMPGQYVAREEKLYKFVNFDIKILNVHALFESLIAVDFSSSEKQKNKSCTRDVFIKLLGYSAKSSDVDDYSASCATALRHSIKIYPDALSHTAVLNTEYQKDMVLSPNSNLLLANKDKKSGSDRVQNILSFCKLQ